MAYPIKIDVKGLDVFAGVPTIAQKKVAEQYAKIVVRIAKRIVPVRTGRLRASIKAVGSNVVADAPYAGFVEYGTRFMPGGRPYIRPALEKAKPQLRKLVDEILQKSLKKAETKGRREAIREVRTESEERLSALIESMMDVGAARSRLQRAVRGLLRTWGSFV